MPPPIVGPSVRLSWEGTLDRQVLCAETLDPCKYLTFTPLERGRVVVTLDDGTFDLGLYFDHTWSIRPAIATHNSAGGGAPAQFSAEVEAQVGYHLAVSRWREPLDAPFHVQVEGPPMTGSAKPIRPCCCC